MTIFKEWTLALNILSGLIHNPAAQKRSIKRVHRFLDRLNGKKRVLWFITYGGTFKDCEKGRAVSTLWVRYPNGLQRVTELKEDVHTFCGETGFYSELSSTSKAYFDQYVRPFITDDLAQAALKVTLTPYVRSTSELRDHPFTPGVREFYELSTSYSATSDIHGNYAPLKYCRFTTQQNTVRVQLRGEQLLLIQNNRVWNISAGRLPRIELSAGVREGIRQLAWELAERRLHTQELSALRQYAAGNDDVSLLLCAIRFPQATHLYGLLNFIQFASPAVRRLILRHKGGLKELIRKLFGVLPATATALFKNPGKCNMARLLHESGFQSPDLKMKVLTCHQLTSTLSGRDFRWYVEAVGEKVAAYRLTQTSGYNDHPERMLYELADCQELYETVQAAGQTFKLSGLSIHEIHEQLSRIHRRLQHENLPIPSAQNPKLNSLDQDLLCPEFGLLQFRRARQTHELIETGEVLHNCVSGYMSHALTGQAIIVIARDALNVPKICLEIRDNKLCQYKLDRNDRPRTEATITTALNYIQAARLQNVTHDVPNNLTPEQLHALRQELGGGAGQAAAEAIFVNDDLPF